jgi:hypothetical protein
MSNSIVLHRCCQTIEEKTINTGEISTSSCYVDDIGVSMGKGTSKLKTTSIGVFPLVKEHFD